MNKGMLLAGGYENMYEMNGYSLWNVKDNWKTKVFVSIRMGHMMLHKFSDVLDTDFSFTIYVQHGSARGSDQNPRFMIIVGRRERGKLYTGSSYFCL